MPDNNSNSKNINTNNETKVESYGVVANQSSDNIQDALKRLKIQETRDQFGMAPWTLYPNRPGEPNCVYYVRTGTCGYGVNCRFNHPPNAALSAPYREELPERIGQPDCGYYLKTGTCKYGSSCKYNHPRDRNGAGPVTLNTIGLPMRQGEKSCSHYMRTGFCKFGLACKFHHPQPMGIPVSISAAYGSTGASAVPSSNLSYAGGYSSWLLPTATYPPTVLPPAAPQGWNTYMGNLVPSSSAILESNGASTEQVTHLPERPDQPECRYFMSNGSCKYGSDCKYHHPKERIAQLTISTGPHGLPSRPGQTPCSMYITHGICQFGQHCRFDHPFTGYPYGYGSALPTTVNSTLVTYPTVSAGVTPLPPSSKLPDSESNRHQSPDTLTKAASDELAEASSEPSQD